MTTPYDDDPELRERLRTADPAASLPPAGAERVALLLEDAMSHDQLTETRETGTHDRSPLTWTIAAAAAVVIIGVGLFVVLSRDTGATPGPVAGADQPTVTELGAPGAAAAGARCAAPQPDVLARADAAFDGTVVEITDGRVTLAPTEWFAGTPTDTVVVTAPAADLSALLLSVSFREGERYLVAAEGSTVKICGYSAPYDAATARLYDEAFPG